MWPHAAIRNSCVYTHSYFLAERQFLSLFCAQHWFLCFLYTFAVFSEAVWCIDQTPRELDFHCTTQETTTRYSAGRYCLRSVTFNCCVIWKEKEREFTLWLCSHTCNSVFVKCLFSYHSPYCWQEFTIIKSWVFWVMSAKSSELVSS